MKTSISLAGEIIMASILVHSSYVSQYGQFICSQKHWPCHFYSPTLTLETIWIKEPWQRLLQTNLRQTLTARNPFHLSFNLESGPNAHQLAGGIEGGELEDGYLLLHFPGLEEKRWKLMDKWLDGVEKTPEKFEIELSKSIYAIQVREYWNLVRKIQRVVQDAWGVQHGFRDNIRADEEVEMCQALLAVPRYDKLWPGDDMLQLMREHVDALESTAQNQVDGYHGTYP